MYGHLNVKLPLDRLQINPTHIVFKNHLLLFYILRPDLSSGLIAWGFTLKCCMNFSSPPYQALWKYKLLSPSSCYTL